jgi:hypothetical protein
VSTCPPRQCGIATFSRDLEQAILTADRSVRIEWAAVNEATSIHAYGPEVRWRIRQGDPDSYRRAAQQLNVAPVDVVCLQHEFGLYGIWADPFEDPNGASSRRISSPSSQPSSTASGRVGQLRACTSNQTAA